jgi:hypothetical protein
VVNSLRHLATLVFHERNLRIEDLPEKLIRRLGKNLKFWLTRQLRKKVPAVARDGENGFALARQP